MTSYIAELLLLSLTLFGVLRWKKTHRTSGIWQLMYAQVEISNPELATLAMLQLNFGQGLIYVAVATLACTPTAVRFLPNIFRTYI